MASSPATNLLRPVPVERKVKLNNRYFRNVQFPWAGLNRTSAPGIILRTIALEYGRVYGIDIGTIVHIGIQSSAGKYISCNDLCMLVLHG